MAERGVMAEAVLELEKIDRVYDEAGHALAILQNADLTLKRGEFVALVGPSGAGKSTLLHVAGLLERPTNGTVRVGGRDAGTMSDAERTKARREEIGFVYQFHHLLPEFSALENVVIPQLIAGTKMGPAKARARELLAAVGLTERETHRPAKLSGGEQQRVALVQGPSPMQPTDPARRRADRQSRPPHRRSGLRRTRKTDRRHRSGGPDRNA